MCIHVHTRAHNMYKHTHAHTQTLSLLDLIHRQCEVQNDSKWNENERKKIQIQDHVKGLTKPPLDDKRNKIKNLNFYMGYFVLKFWT